MKSKKGEEKNKKRHVAMRRELKYKMNLSKSEPSKRALDLEAIFLLT